MKFQLNGKIEEITQSLNFSELLQRHQLKPNQVAVARNGEVLLRSQLVDVQVEEGDVVEIFHAVGGGWSLSFTLAKQS